MSSQVRPTSAAHADLIQAYDWYERQSPGLGKEFVRAVDAAMAVIELADAVAREVQSRP